MILILSTKIDFTTDLVIDWLIKYKAKFIRLNDSEFFENDASFKFQLYSSGESNLQMDNGFGDCIDVSKIKVVWYRKFGFLKESNSFGEIRKRYSQSLCKHFSKEYVKILELIKYCLKDKKWLTSPDNIILSKIEVLHHAVAVGLEVPDSFIVNTQHELKKLIQMKSNLISKTIHEVSPITNGKKVYTMYTKRISNEDMEYTSNQFFPSFIQSEVKKKYEIRTFFLQDNFYSLAIFSQQGDKSKIDFREPNNEKAFRCVPYKLPRKVEYKIQMLMRRLGINCGSLDLLYSIDDRYVFLEINPVGQFGFVSSLCNYRLEKLVARTLIKMNNEK